MTNTFTSLKIVRFFIRLDQGSISSTCLRKAFTHVDPTCAKKDSQVMSQFTLLGSRRVKALCKHVVEIDIIHAN